MRRSQTDLAWQKLLALLDGSLAAETRRFNIATKIVAVIDTTETDALVPTGAGRPRDTLLEATMIDSQE